MHRLELYFPAGKKPGKRKELVNKYRIDVLCIGPYGVCKDRKKEYDSLMKRSPERYKGAFTKIVKNG